MNNQMDNIVSIHETLSQKQTDLICKIDGTELSVLFRDEDGFEGLDATARLAYVEANRGQYYVAINAWLALLADHGLSELLALVVDCLHQSGLLRTLEIMNATADKIVGLVSGNDCTVTDDDIAVVDSTLTCDLRTALQCLRFLRRFTPKSTMLLKNAASKFLDIQHRLNWRLVASEKSADPDVIPPYDMVVLPIVKKYFNKVLSGLKPYYEASVGGLSNGSSTDGKELTKKLAGMAKYQATFDWGWYPILPFERKTVEFHHKTLEVIAVPKNYKSGRIIAPEPAYVVWQCTRMRRAIEMRLKCSPYNKYLDPSDQERQKALAFIGSSGDTWCTIDSTSASDSIARYVMRYLMDTDELRWLWDWCTTYMPEYYIVGGKKVRAATFLTSGNPLTFILESIFFWSVGMAAREFHCWVLDLSQDESDAIPWCSVFGDDANVAKQYVEEFVMFLERLGIRVNVSKSFSKGLYRESCGVEYFDQEPVRSRYWPRKTILTGKEPTAEDYASLIELQHKVYDYPKCRNFMKDAILGLWPKTTFSRPGYDEAALDSSGDLWGLTFKENPTKKHPYGAYWREGYVESPYQQEYGVNTGHTAVVAKRENFKVSETNLVARCLDSAVQMYYYQEFLRVGPQYANDIERACGVSTRTEKTGVWNAPDLVIKVVYGDF